jgi:hypothetical protein
MVHPRGADTASVLVGRRYAVALCVAILAFVAYVAVPKHSAGRAQLSTSQLHAMEVAALQRLRLPQSFKRLDKGCRIGRCYVANAPATEVEAMMPGLLRSAGFQPPGKLLAAEPIALLRADHWSTTSRDPLVMACKRISSSGTSPAETCQDAGRIGSTLLNVLVRPAVACPKGTCVELPKAQVTVWSAALPGNA